MSDEGRDTETPASTWLAAFQADTQREHADLRRRELSWSWARLVASLGAIAVWILLRDRVGLAAAVSAPLVVGFAVAVGRHVRVRARREFADRLLLVTAESIRRGQGQVTLIRSHERPADPADPAAAVEPGLPIEPSWKLTGQERDDLDFYAPPVGLFGLLNRTSTALGARRLRDLLEHPALCAARLKQRQEAVRWLDEHPAERLRLLAAAAELRDRDPALERLVVATRQTQPLPRPVYSLVMRLWTLPSALFTLVALERIMGGSASWAVWAIALFVLAGINAARFHWVRRAIQERIHPFRDVFAGATGYLAVARQATADLPDTTELGTLKTRFAAVAEPGLLPGLCRWLPWTETGGMFHVLFNILLFYDVHVAQGIVSHIVPHRERFLTGLSALAELDALLGLGCFACEQAGAGYPVLADAPALTITAGRHPLIAPERVVPNTVTLTPTTHVWVITGSNMAGKSTFLRMTGTNVLLAQLGTAVAADAMTWSPFRLITDLGVRDDLANEESYFLAEVRHLRRMVTPPAGDTPVLGLIDEPFRGTNSEEQVAASLAVLEHLIGSPHFHIVATHERRLTDLADGTAATNHHFREDLEADGLVFDYRLRAGPSQTRTALRVLARENYPADLVERAHAWVNHVQRDAAAAAESASR